MSVLRLSNSEMSTWRRCQRKWWLSSYRRLKPAMPPHPGSALSIGDLVHDALAQYYDPDVRLDPIAYVQNLIDEDIAAMPMLEDDLLKERDLVTIMLEGYFEWLAETGHDQDLVIHGAERMVDVPMTPEGDVRLLSKLDAPVERVSDGAKLALEHKTTGSLDKNLEGLKLNTQFLTEHLARFMADMAQGATAEEAYDACHGILLNQLRKVKRTAQAKPPFYAREDVPHNIHELRNHWKHVMSTARQIQAATARLDAGEDHQLVVPPNPISDRCPWDCPFYKVCVMFDDGSDAEGAIEAMYVDHDPLERYAGAEAL